MPPRQSSLIAADRRVRAATLVLYPSPDPSFPKTLAVLCNAANGALHPSPPEIQLYSFTKREGHGCLWLCEGLDGEAGRGGREPRGAEAHHRGLRHDAGP